MNSDSENYELNNERRNYLTKEYSSGEEEETSDITNPHRPFNSKSTSQDSSHSESLAFHSDHVNGSSRLSMNIAFNKLHI